MWPHSHLVQAFPHDREIQPETPAIRGLFDVMPFWHTTENLVSSLIIYDFLYGPLSRVPESQIPC